MDAVDFPAWLRVEHWVNLLFLTLLVRSGVEILAAHPKLYRGNDSTPGSEWARFTRKALPRDRLTDSLDEEESWSSVVALPGHKNLGMGRHWHFVSVIGWVLTGLVYYVLLFATGQWQRYIPSSWGIFAVAWNDVLTYLSLELPSRLPGEPFDAVQKLSYAAVIFLLAPFQIVTGFLQAPAVEGRHPRLMRAAGGRQTVRTLHFLGLLAFVLFLAVHLIMIGLWGWATENAKMIFGQERDPGWAIALSLVIVAAVIVLHVVATVWSLRRPRSVQRSLGAVISAGRRLALRPLASRQDYPRAALSRVHRVNGKPPTSDAYKVMAVHRFVDWSVDVGGLVENPVRLNLADLRALREPQTQRVLHNCIQGWSSVGEWGGLPLRTLVELVRPTPEATHICFLTMQDTGRDEPSAAAGGRYYEIIDLDLARHPQTLLAYEMNGEPLPIRHGAPLRLRVENQVGFKMAKWIDRIEFVGDYRPIGAGMGGWREDNVYYDQDVEV